MVYQALTQCSRFLCRQLIQLNMEAFLQSSAWRSSHLELSIQNVSNNTDQFLEYAMHVVEFHLEHWEVSFVL